jgi:hypothetical protein
MTETITDIIRQETEEADKIIGEEGKATKLGNP